MSSLIWFDELDELDFELNRVLALDDRDASGRGTVLVHVKLRALVRDIQHLPAEWQADARACAGAVTDVLLRDGFGFNDDGVEQALKQMEKKP